MAIYVALDRRARVVRGLLALGIFVGVASLGSNLAQLELLQRAGSIGVSAEEAASNDLRQQALAVAEMVSLLATALAFLVWIHRAHGNLGALGNRSLSYSPRWAVGGFFVPVLNMIRPAQVMREIWYGSDPEDPAWSADTAGSAPVLRYPGAVAGWWLCFIASNLASTVAGIRAMGDEPTVDRLVEMTRWFIGAGGLTIASAVLAYRLVGTVTQMQCDRWSTLESDDPAPTGSRAPPSDGEAAVESDALTGQVARRG